MNNPDTSKYKKTLAIDPDAVYIDFPDSVKRFMEPFRKKVKNRIMSKIVDEISNAFAPIKEMFEKYPGVFEIHTIDGKPQLNIDLDQLDKFL